MPQPVSRRRVVGGLSGTLAGGSLLVAGCSADLSTGAQPDQGATPRAGLSADETTVADLVARLTTSVDLLTRTGRRYPLLVAPLAATLAAERTHLATLRRSARAAALPSPPAPAPLPQSGGRSAALVGARQSVTSLRSAYLSAARQAESGSFARLLASMGCSLSQRLPGISL